MAMSLGVAACGDDPPPDPAVCQGLEAASRPVRSSQCGPTLDLTPINSYQGEIAEVQVREDAVVLINGTCTGTLIAAAAGPVVLTAGHCVAPGEQVVLAFNVEEAPDGDPLVTGGTVFEQSTEPDYGLIRLDKLPAATPTPLTTQATDLLAVIQHARGRPKSIAEGSYLDACNGLVYYADLDTLVGSSGAGVLNRQGYLLAVHTDGDCAADGTGTNHGWSAADIVEASPYLLAADLADR
jgi:hypothetical protein